MNDPSRMFYLQDAPQSFAAQYGSAESIEGYYQHRKFGILGGLIARFADGPMTVLDIGTGYGELLDIARECAPGSRLIGLDLSPALLKQVSSRHWAVLADGEEIPLRDTVADVVFLFDVIEHLWSPDRLLREIRRVLKPGGHLLVTTPNLFGVYEYKEFVYPGKRAYLNDLLTLRALRRKPRRYFPYHVRLYTRRELLAVLEAHGFRVLSVRTSNFCLPGLGWIERAFGVYKSATFLRFLQWGERHFSVLNHLIIAVCERP